MLVPRGIGSVHLPASVRVGWCPDKRQLATGRQLAVDADHRAPVAGAAEVAVEIPNQIIQARSSVAAIRAHQTAGGGIYLGTRSDGWVWSGQQQATLVLGPPRSGKTSAIVVPSVAASAGAVVCTSTKPDIAQTTVGFRRQTGPCHVFDPSGTAVRVPGTDLVRWSPVTSCGSWDMALLAASSLVDTARRVGAGGAVRPMGNDHWTERATALLAPILHAGALGGADMATVVGWIDRHQAEPALEILDQYEARVAGDLLAGIAITDPREQSGIWSTASGSLAAYRSHGALSTAREPNFDPAAFIDAGATLYICAPAHQQAVFAPLVVALLADVRNAIYARSASLDSQGLPRPQPVLFALDEVANIAPLPDLPAMVSEGGGQGLLILACLQDLSQARTRWGGAADGFLSLFGTTVVLPGIGDTHTLRSLSDLAGEHDVLYQSVSAPNRPPRSRGAALARRIVLGQRGSDPGIHRAPTVTATAVPRRRLTIDEAAHGRPGAALMLDRTKNLHWIGLTPWFCSEPWRSAIGHTRDVPDDRYPCTMQLPVDARSTERPSARGWETGLGR